MFALPAICLPLLKPVKPQIQYRYCIVGTSFFVCYILVIVPGVIGYLMFVDDKKEIILDYFSNKDVIIQKKSILFLANAQTVLAAIVLPNICPGISVGRSLGGRMTSFFFPAIFWIKKSAQIDALD